MIKALKNKFRAAISWGALSLAMLAGNNALAADLDVDGIWMTSGRSGIVELKDCGDSTPCGTLIWVLPYNDGSLPKDDNNPDVELATRDLLGVQMLSGFRRSGEKWKSGRIYNPEDGKTYRSGLERASETILKVKGCVGPICQTQIWHRLPFDTLPSDILPSYNAQP